MYNPVVVGRAWPAVVAKSCLSTSEKRAQPRRQLKTTANSRQQAPIRLQLDIEYKTRVIGRRCRRGTVGKKGRAGKK